MRPASSVIAASIAFSPSSGAAAARGGEGGVAEERAAARVAGRARRRTASSCVAGQAGRTDGRGPRRRRPSRPARRALGRAADVHVHQRHRQIAAAGRARRRRGRSNSAEAEPCARPACGGWRGAASGAGCWAGRGRAGAEAATSGPPDGELRRPSALTRGESAVAGWSRRSAGPIVAWRGRSRTGVGRMPDRRVGRPGGDDRRLGAGRRRRPGAGGGGAARWRARAGRRRQGRRRRRRRTRARGRGRRGGRPRRPGPAGADGRVAVARRARRIGTPAAGGADVADAAAEPPSATATAQDEERIRATRGARADVCGGRGHEGGCQVIRMSLGAQLLTATLDPALRLSRGVRA